LSRLLQQCVDITFQESGGTLPAGQLDLREWEFIHGPQRAGETFGDFGSAKQLGRIYWCEDF